MTEKRREQPPVIFNTHGDILARYDQLFTAQLIEHEIYYIEDNEPSIREPFNPFRFFLTPNRLVAVVTEEANQIWEIPLDTKGGKRMLEIMNTLAYMKKSQVIDRDLIGIVDLPEGTFSYKIFPYGHKLSSSLAKYLLDQRRLGYLVNNALSGVE